jgi:hypothetical protein
VSDGLGRLTRALSDRYRIERELGDVIYLQSPAENLEYYVRVVPGWVKTMKRAVDAVNQ